MEPVTLVMDAAWYCPEADMATPVHETVSRATLGTFIQFCPKFKEYHIPPRVAQAVWNTAVALTATLVHRILSAASDMVHVCP